jgi:hypothetical protein
VSSNKQTNPNFNRVRNEHFSFLSEFGSSMLLLINSSDKSLEKCINISVKKEIKVINLYEWGEEECI